MPSSKKREDTLRILFSLKQARDIFSPRELRDDFISVPKEYYNETISRWECSRGENMSRACVMPQKWDIRTLHNMAKHLYSLRSYNDGVRIL